MADSHEEIRATTVLRAHREDITLTTEDGLELVGELALPATGPISGTLITMHPLPTHGGFMDSHIFRKAAWRLPELAGIAVLRFNTRGTSSPRGTSQGAFDGHGAESADLRAAVAFAIDRGLPNRWIVGWSFGTEITLQAGHDQDVEGAILLSPPLHRATAADMERWAATAKPVTVMVPELDTFLPPEPARSGFAPLAQARIIAVPGAKHLWVGEKYVRRVLDEIVTHVAPERAPLPHAVRAEMVES